MRRRTGARRDEQMMDGGCCSYPRRTAAERDVQLLEQTFNCCTRRTATGRGVRLLSETCRSWARRTAAEGDRYGCCGRDVWLVAAYERHTAVVDETKV